MIWQDILKQPKLSLGSKTLTKPRTKIKVSEENDCNKRLKILAEKYSKLENKYTQEWLGEGPAPEPERIYSLYSEIPEDIACEILELWNNERSDYGGHYDEEYYGEAYYEVSFFKGEPLEEELYSKRMLVTSDEREFALIIGHDVYHHSHNSPEKDSIYDNLHYIKG